MMRKIIILVLFLISINNIFSQEYYADLSLDVDSKGDILISGVDSSNEFKLNQRIPDYTSKDGKYWLINITSNQIYSNFIFDITLPKGAQINYIKTTPNFRIDEDSGRIKIIGTGENKKVTIIMQYQITDENNKENILKNPNLIGVLGVIIGILITFILNRKKKEVITINQKENEIDFSIFPQRQKDIINILKKKGKITQKELEIEMQIPKSSVSRNVRTLEIKSIIKKESVGSTNYISLK